MGEGMKPTSNLERTLKMNPIADMGPGRAVTVLELQLHPEARPLFSRLRRPSPFPW